jgi:polyribonucleotide nucleotidyltransferase
VRATRTFKYGAHDVTIETGIIARQADGAVLVNMADTVVLVTAVGEKKDVDGRDFFPLTVNYQEKTYAAGRIPGGFFKREGRPTEKETLTSRLIDRPIRPLFPDGFMREVQVIATVLSMNTEVDSDIPAMLGASAALALSGLPFLGPIGGARVGYRNGQYLLNPTATELKESELDLVVAGTKDAVLMVESQAEMLSEEVMLGAVMFGHEQMQTAIQAIESLAKEAGRASINWKQTATDEALVRAVEKFAPQLTEAYGIAEKQTRYAKIGEIKKQCVAQLAPEGAAWTAGQVEGEFHNVERGSTVATRARFDRSTSRSACCRARTARPCSRVARPRRSSSRRSAPAAMRRSSTRSKASGATRSCCTTTSLRIALARQALSGLQSAARSVTAASPDAASKP